MYQDKLGNPLEVKRSDPRHTGTYTCGYANQSLSHLNVWIHLYVNGRTKWGHDFPANDEPWFSSCSVTAMLTSSNLSPTCAPPSDPSNTKNMFVTPRSVPEAKEGQDFLFKCLLTDPTVSNLTLQPEDNRIQGLPNGMTVTFDPKRGALIRDLRQTFTGHYVCSGWKDGKQFKSRPLDLMVFHGKTCLPGSLHCFTACSPGHMTCVCLPAGPPPSVSVSQEESIALEGEKFEVTCLSINPTYLSNFTWKHSKTRVRGYAHQCTSVCVSASMGNWGWTWNCPHKLNQIAKSYFFIISGFKMIHHRFSTYL